MTGSVHRRGKTWSAVLGTYEMNQKGMRVRKQRWIKLYIDDRLTKDEQKIEAERRLKEILFEHNAGILYKGRYETSLGNLEIGQTPTKLTPAEQLVFDKLRSAGYSVFYKGWPDFLAISSHGKIKLVEVKAPGDSIKPHQTQMHRALKLLAGIQVEIYQVTPSEFPGGKIPRHFPFKHRNRRKKEIGELTT